MLDIRCPRGDFCGMCDGRGNVWGMGVGAGGAPSVKEDWQEGRFDMREGLNVRGGDTSGCGCVGTCPIGLPWLDARTSSNEGSSSRSGRRSSYLGAQPNMTTKRNKIRNIKLESGGVQDWPSSLW